MFVYYLGKRYGWSLRTTLVLELVIAIGPFMTGSTLLYLDLIDWPLPPTPGSVWMFHTNITGIQTADVPVALAAFMLLIYPLWILLGDIFARRLDLGFVGLRELSYRDVRSHREKPTANVVVKRGHNPRELTREAVNALGGIRCFVKQNDQVMIKANICGGNPTIPGSYTSMEVVEELVEMIREAAGNPFVVDSDMIWTKFDAAAEDEGWKEWAKRTDVPLVNLNKTKQIRFNFGEGSAIGRVPVSETTVKADVIISVPTMKTHLLCNVTLGMKNMYGTFPEENKAKFHRFKIENVIYEVNEALTPTLTVIDGTIGGEAWGPLSSRPLGFETIVASNDVVAADAVACQLIGYDPFEVAHIKMAHDRGLGNGNVRFDFSTLSYGNEKDGKWVKPDPSVTTFYEGLVEALLLFPGAQNLFDLAADFVLLGMARLPIFRDMTPMTEAVLNDILAGLFRSGYRVAGWSDDDLKKMQNHLDEFWNSIGVRASVSGSQASSLLVVADTHLGLLLRKSRLGLRSDAESDSIEFANFLEWVKGLEIAPEKISTGRWGNREVELRRPDKLVLLGDFLELWDASDAAIEFDSRKVWQKLGDMSSEIVYLVGNHDHAIKELAGETFPAGKKPIEIVEDSCIETVGAKRYVFLHGQQFDRSFRRVRAWTLMSYIRDGAETFRLYSWFIVALTALWLGGLLLGLSKDWSPLIILLALATLPKLITVVARPIFNRMKCLHPRYSRLKALKGFAAWWTDFLRHERPRADPLVIVYGHTHLADIFTSEEVSKLTNKTIQSNVSLINIPAWARETSEKHKSVLRDAALYIDSEGPKFIGWNWSTKKPFYIPDDIVRLRADAKVLDTTTAQQLKNIGWPDKMLEKWKTPYPEDSPGR